MSKKIIITNYDIKNYQHQNIYSAGPDRHFKHPCIAYIKSGYAQFLYKGKTLYAYEGDLVYIAQGTKYTSIWYGSPDISWNTIIFDFKSQYDFCEYEFQVLKNYPAELVDKMYDSYNDSYMLSISYFYQLLNDIHKKLKSIPEHISNTTIAPAIDYIENNYSQNISISTLARLCKCSESGLFKIFKSSTGVTPVAYKHNTMIQHALELLSNTDLSIEEVSSKVGFSSSDYFRKVFFKLTGKRPKDLKKSNL